MILRGLARMKGDMLRTELRHLPAAVAEGTRVADIVQCGLSTYKMLHLNDLGTTGGNATCKSLIEQALQAWLAALDDFRNWLIREAA